MGRAGEQAVVDLQVEVPVGRRRPDGVRPRRRHERAVRDAPPARREVRTSGRHADPAVGGIVAIPEENPTAHLLVGRQYIGFGFLCEQ